ncbi:hypothetical protein BRADI_1g66673v3 [Brachypodium distachyon]|uniref:Uncharacterized protein n=1 Tax=Brachypodium distachyon TaxID=15368 RepID=A0A2K2DTQ7_BRADI|nr:hypothetical protein BRADI_1g66673v3 [Brachypodium distachyon]
MVFAGSLASGGSCFSAFSSPSWPGKKRWHDTHEHVKNKDSVVRSSTTDGWLQLPTNAEGLPTHMVILTAG